MSYQVLARRWRPQTFEEVVGQETVTRTLQNAIRSGRIAHAFLFSGVRGVGKTTTARILAKALNCAQGPTPQPCGECPACREIAAASCVDVQEIDAASNTGVDSIRELREGARYHPARDRFKIYIIDEVHMLSNAAFNALLKTLEEPPAHVKFILATTEHQKIPVTITSRCQQFDFKPIPYRLMLERLRLICRQEQIEISDYALRAVVEAARGSMRDAQSALDQIISFSGRKVEDGDVLALLGVVDSVLVNRILAAIADQQATALLEQLQSLAGHGVDPQNFCRKLIEQIRHLLVVKIAGWEPRLLNLPDTEKEPLLELAERFSELDLIRFYDQMVRVEGELRRHVHPEIHLEMALLRLVELARLPRLEEVLSRLEEGREVPQMKPSGAPAPRRERQEGQKRAGNESEGQRGEAGESGDKEDQIISRLQLRLQKEAPSLFSSLEVASLQRENQCLKIIFPPGERVHYEIVKQPEKLDLLTRLFCELSRSKGKVILSLCEEEAGEVNSPGDPTQDPKVRALFDAFPGKMIVEHTGEEPS